MKRTYIESLLVSSIVMLLGGFAGGQVASGGTYSLSQTVIASGGSTSSGGAFIVEGSAGQSVAGGSQQNSPFSVYSGFWTPAPLIPTAATTSISGRVRTAEGAGITNVILTLTNASGDVLAARTSPFGYYRFEGVLAGETYILRIRSKRYTFSQSTRVLSVLDNLENVDFIADGVN
jgi:Carboxypeptidase regulatory-like domain